MFESVLDAEAPDTGAPWEEDWFDPAWLDEGPVLPETPGPSVVECAPSGWLALELDHGTADPARLSDTELIDTIVGFDRVTSWASARQARLLAEFARRRPRDDGLITRCDRPSAASECAPDEIGLALRLSRTTAANRLAMAEVLVADLPGTLAAWQAGTIDGRKTQAITETSYLLAPEQRGALEARVLPRAGAQTLAQLRAALARAVLAIDPHGAAERHAQRRQDRRVVVSPEEDGMASLWALLSAPDATAAYHRLGQLARALGADDPRGMDARRADLLVELLTGRRCATTGLHTDTEDGAHDGADPEERDDGCDGTSTDSPPVQAAPTPTDTTPTDPADPHPADLDTQHRDETARGGHDCTRGTSTGPGKPLISVIVPITTLMGLDEHPGELIGYGPIPAALAREIAAGGTWRRLLTDPASGALLDYGRTTYTPPAALADFVRARDVYCRNPICGHRAATADLDHTIPWPDGDTSESNLHASCRHHHLIKTHTPGWQVDQHPDSRITWTTPTGHAYTSHPHDYRPDPHHHPPGTPGTDTTAGPDPPEDDEPPF
ncbi:MAG: DUF222 domain-containing protein [Pseudonocardiaceae bacterium]